MAYHITSIVNNSAAAVSITNPAYKNDSIVVSPGQTYNPGNAILVNTGVNNQSWAQALPFANNFYTVADDYCIWDNGNSQVIGVGEKWENQNNDKTYLTAPAGNVQVTIDASGHLSFATVS